MPTSTSFVDAPGGAVVVSGVSEEVAKASLSSAATSDSVSWRSFSRRTSLPRLWQYQKMKSRT